MLAVALALAVLLALSARAGEAKPEQRVMALGGSQRAAAAEEEWWKHAIVYQIYPRSFMDTDGDGIGDLDGITQQLPYLKEIGVTAVWLSPFYPSPKADGGYDISDFKDVDPDYGNLDKFKKMVDTAHGHGMKVVVDLVPNHSSDEHEWFKQSVKDPKGKYGNYYVWKDPGGIDVHTGKPDPPNNWVSHFRGSAWTYNEERKQFYLHQFDPKQPDLNYSDPGLVQEMKDVFTFWMDHGVDGFRVDALPFLFEENYDQDEPKQEHPSPDVDDQDYDFYTHPHTMDKEGTYQMLRQWRQLVDAHPDKKPRVIMTECYTTFDNTIKYYGTEAEPGAHFTFNFQIITALNKASKASDFKTVIDQWLNAMDWRWPNWVIGNHDNSRVATRYPNMADAMNMISLTLPGTAMTYNGEEIGMTDAYIRWDQTQDPQAIRAGEEKYLRVTRDPCRTPIQWNSNKNAGFSTNDTTWMPTNPNYWELNVESQKKQSKSHLNVYKDLAQLRQKATMKGKDNWKTDVIKDDILAITRKLDGDDTYVTLVNVGSWEKAISKADLPADVKDKDLWVYTASTSSTLFKGDRMTSLTLRPKAGVVLSTAPEATPAPPMDSTTQGGSRTAALVPLLFVPLLAYLQS